MEQEVIGLDNFSTGQLSNLNQIEQSIEADLWKNFTFLEGDIRDFKFCKKSCEGIEIVLHQAALGSVPRSIENPLTTNDVNISVGFNRRFAPLAKRMKKALGSSKTPINIVATMNAGFIPKDVWIHDMEIGGGRIIGEACHFIDLCTYLSGSKIVSVCMNSMGKNPDENTDNASILLKYENGTNAVINYFANGSKGYSKERLEVYSQERTLILDNWRRLKGYGFKGFSSAKSSQDKGHFNQFQELIRQQKNGGKAIIPFDEIVNTTKASFAAIDSLKQGKWISIK